MQLLNNPSLEEAEQSITRALQSKQLLLVVGSCSVDYKGRAAATLGEGERVLMIKEDRSVTVHKKDRHAPVNYQTAGCEIIAAQNDGALVVESFKRKDNDRLRVSFSNVQFVGTFALQDSEVLDLIGAEKDFVKMVLANPDLIEPGLKPETVEKMIPTGGIDIYAKDKDGNYVVVELKRRTAGLNEVNQLKRYVDEVRRVKPDKIRGILAAPGISDRAKKMLYSFGLEFAKLDPSIDKLRESSVSIVKDQARLGEFV